MSVFFASCTTTQVAEKTDTGIFKFSEKDLTDHTIFELTGEWDFYWDTLLTPGQIRNTGLKAKKVQVPKRWTHYEINDIPLPRHGYATYQTKLIVPGKEFYCIKIRRIFLSSKIYINDSLVATTGEIATNQKDFVSDRSTKEIIFYVPTDTITLTIQVANFQHIKAGIVRPIQFGKPKPIIDNANLFIFYDTAILGALILLMLFYFILYFNNSDTKTNLYFTIFLLVATLPTTFDGELILIRIFPAISWTIGQKLLYIGWIIRSYMFVVLVESFTKEIFSKTVKKISFYFALVFSIFVIVAKMDIYSRFMPLIYLYALLTLVYELYITLKASKNDKLMLLTAIGISLIILSGINDTLHDVGIFRTMFVSGIGIFLFILTQALLLSIKNARTMNIADNFTNRETMERQLQNALITTPSYELSTSITTIATYLNIDKITLIKQNNQKYEVTLIVEKNKPPKTPHQKLDLTTTNSQLEIDNINQAIKTKQNLILTNKTKQTQNKNTLILPIEKNEEITIILYIENKTNYLNKAQISVLSSLKVQFNSLINTTLAYNNLQNANKILEKKVAKRNEEIKQQGEKIDEKNQQLDEKLQLLEEQYTIQNEINNELQSQVEEIQHQNEILQTQNEKINTQKNIIAVKNRQIKENTQYAGKILKILTVNDTLPLIEFFHLNMPKDIVGGDFFFSKQITDDIYSFALGDCTGHGIPGSLVSIFAIREIEKIIIKNKTNITPAQILDKLRQTVKTRLTNKEENLKDGLDISMCIFNKKTLQLDFAGAYHSLILIRNNKIETIKGDRMTIGNYIPEFEFPFKTKHLQLQKNDLLYTYSDGYVDQFNSETNEKFYTTRLKKLLTEIQQKPLKQQKQILKQKFTEFKGTYYQIDDVSVIGLKI